MNYCTSGSVNIKKRHLLSSSKTYFILTIVRPTPWNFRNWFFSTWNLSFISFFSYFL